VAPQQKVKLTEIFYSLQGEADTAGIPTIFIRLTGCPLRCQYCDTAYAFSGGQWWDFDAILAHMKRWSTRYVCVTGGEPLAQPACLPLLALLCDQQYRVSLETSGAMPIAAVDPRVVRVVDIKTPGSKEEHRNLYDELRQLRSTDLVKFVICDRQDYEWSRAKLQELQLNEHCTVLFSASHTELPANTLADWILADQLTVRLQVQLHKYLWGNIVGR
jgi:7-carboxy-7-deazaguanine synthase